MAAQGVPKIVAQRVAQQFVRGSAAIVANHDLHGGVVQHVFDDAVVVQIRRADLKPGLERIQRRFQCHQIAPHRAAQMGQIKPAEQTMPVGVIGLCGVEQAQQARVFTPR